MPDPVEPTPDDLETFRDRMKAAIAEAGTTAKALEASLELSKGTFTRIYGGRRQIDEELLRRAADALQVAPEALVKGTAFEGLLLAAHAEEVEAAPEEVEASPEEAEAAPEEAEASPEEAEAAPEEAEAAPEEAEAAPEDAVDDASRSSAGAPAEERPPSEAPRDREQEEKRRSRMLDVPVRAAVAIAGGLALVGGTLAALLRRR